MVKSYTLVFSLMLLLACGMAGAQEATPNRQSEGVAKVSATESKSIEQHLNGMSLHQKQALLAKRVDVYCHVNDDCLNRLLSASNKAAPHFPKNVFTDQNQEQGIYSVIIEDERVKGWIKEHEEEMARFTQAITVRHDADKK